MSLHRVAELPDDGLSTVRVPLLGQRLCAGFPSPADDFLEGAIELPRWLVPNPPATFLWQISGESMRGAGIFDRDLACVDRSLKAGHDCVVVAVVNGQMSIKRLVIEGNRARLAFDNPDLPAFAVEAWRRPRSGAWCASPSAGTSCAGGSADEPDAGAHRR